MDTVSAKTRSKMMSGIKGSNTKPELQVRRYLHGLGFRYKLHVRELPGRPDLVLPRWNVVVQIHGCFWHGHDDCPFATKPATRADFWRKKINDNARRDERTHAELRSLGWRVGVVWECALRKAEALSLHALANFIESDQFEIDIGMRGIRTHLLQSTDPDGG